MKKIQKSKTAKMKTWKKVLIIISVVIVVCILSASLLVYGELSKIKKYVPEATVAPQNETFETEQPVNSSAPVVEPQNVIWPSVKPIEDGKIINILLIGQDRRPGEPRERSDSMIILSYNPADKTAKLISLMRDLYVQIPGYSDNRINAAYQFGGMELLDSVISTNFGVNIDGNLEVDFDGFSKVIDVLGGIDVNLADYDAAFLNHRDNWSLVAGMNHLNGEQALQYSRIRNVGNSDYERTERQRNVITAIIDKVLTLSSTEKAKMFDEMLPYLTTDMTNQQMLGYCATVLSNGIDSISKYRIPADGTFTTPVIRGMDVLLPDLDSNQKLLKSYIMG